MLLNTGYSTTTRSTIKLYLLKKNEGNPEISVHHLDIALHKKNFRGTFIFPSCRLIFSTRCAYYNSGVCTQRKQSLTDNQSQKNSSFLVFFTLLNFIWPRAANEKFPKKVIIEFIIKYGPRTQRACNNISVMFSMNSCSSVENIKL